MSIEFRPLHGSFGAEVIGAPPDLAMDGESFRLIEAAWYRHSILLFRGLAMTPGQHSNSRAGSARSISWSRST